MVTICLCTLNSIVYQTVHLTHKPAFVEKAEVNPQQLKPRDVIMPVNPNYTARERQEINATQKPSSEISPKIKQGNESQQGNNLCQIFEKSS
jgi:hypothetical protein